MELISKMKNQFFFISRMYLKFFLRAYVYFYHYYGEAYTDKKRVLIKNSLNSKILYL